MDNPVTKYLTENSTKKLSQYKLKKILNINIRVCKHHIKGAVKDGYIRRVRPLEVGSGKFPKSIVVYTAVVS